jgi:cysteine desulfurase
LNVCCPGVDGAKLLDAIPEIAASTGAACHDRSVSLSHVLGAMNVPKDIGRGALRLTLGRENTREDVDRAAELILSAYAELRQYPLPIP